MLVRHLWASKGTIFLCYKPTLVARVLISRARFITYVDVKDLSRRRPFRDHNNVRIAAQCLLRITTRILLRHLLVYECIKILHCELRHIARAIIFFVINYYVEIAKHLASSMFYCVNILYIAMNFIQFLPYTVMKCFIY